MWVVCAVVVCASALAGCGENSPGTTGPAPERPSSVKIVSELPMSQAYGKEQAQAIELVLEQHGNRAGPFAIEYEPFNTADARKDQTFEVQVCEGNAKEHVADESVVGVIGTFYSPCTALELPIANEASLAYVSNSNLRPGLTHAAPGTEPGEPDRYYPSGVRNYARVVPPSDHQAEFDAGYMSERLGVTRVYVLDDQDPYYGKAVADAFEAAAVYAGVEVVGRSGWDEGADSYAALMVEVKESGAEAVYIAGISDFNGAQLMKDKVAIVGSNEVVPVLASDGFVVTSFIEEAGADIAEGMYGSAPLLTPEEHTGAGAEFIDAFTERYGEPGPHVAYAAAATEVLLDAIARSDGTREDIRAELLKTRMANGILGPVAFDANGDLTDPSFAIRRAESGSWVPLETVRPSDFGQSP